MDSMIITMAVAIILQSVKNPAKKAELKKAMLKIRNAINTAYADDPDFNPPPTI